MDRETAIKEKRAAIAKVIMECAKAVLTQVAIAYPPKRAFRKIDRTPGKRIRKQQARAMIPIVARMAAMQVGLVQSTPIPKFHPGKVLQIPADAKVEYIDFKHDKK